MTSRTAHTGAALDDLDARLVRELLTAPRVGVLELSRRLGVARATVQARLDRLVRRGIIAAFAPTPQPGAPRVGGAALATLEIRQGRGGQGAHPPPPHPRGVGGGPLNPPG